MERVEEKIREKLSKKLDIFKEDLQLLKQEAFLGNKNGTRGFVDILASDSQDRIVLIELKRSKAASREAIHEIFKYIEGIKENRSLKSDEIVAYIVSTEWDELFIPFSSFVAQVDYEVKGFLLNVDSKLDPTSIERITPLDINNERFISDIHAARLYKDKISLRKGINSHINCFKTKCIDDYVLLVLKAHPDLYEYSLRSTAKGLEDVASQFGGAPLKTYDELKKIMPSYEYMIYSAVQVMSEEQYWTIVKSDQDQYDELVEICEDMENEELLHILHEYAVENAEPTPYQDRYEIGYPAKLRTEFLEGQGWEIIDLIRGGKLKKNDLLSDEILVGELSGDSGTNKQVYSKDFNSSSKAALKQITKDVNKCLVDNEIWLVGVEKAIDEISKRSSNQSAQGRIHIFNPSNTLLSLFQSATSSSQLDAMKWIPSYYVNVEYKEYKTAYFGCLVRNEIVSDLQDVLDGAYDGTASSLLFSLSWGGYLAEDIDIAPMYGLEYANFKCEIKGDDRNFFRFDGYRYKPCKELDPYYDYFQFIDQNPEFIRELIEMFREATIAPGILQF